MFDSTNPKPKILKWFSGKISMDISIGSCDSEDDYKVQIIDGADGKCTAEFKVEPEHVNRGGFLHGGFTATVVDMVTTYALMSKPCNPGVTVDLHVTYLKAAKEGDTIVVSANTIRAGKKLAFIECVLMQKNDGAIVAKGSQTKFVECM
ncbi:acyl-coenzyme A thioesterase 13-like isoform X3 [Zeugodacus cucurbitae]|uniref:acyl-coenzyme A thioesterase 13-like isoform X3 n=1 Tax=Zeugodacus cucurbitae TaxID=28588 RepID=UPI0023D953B4|nr:acyl-coenzyme A thioesterase 13-like isoform X3 [Zeugodacus cucurbitae]XP_054085247.1 acyl-coenzyme A thioesterase 13-like isoform X3 [Zeugodacus cucurbitae]